MVNANSSIDAMPDGNFVKNIKRYKIRCYCAAFVLHRRCFATISITVVVRMKLEVSADVQQKDLTSLHQLTTLNSNFDVRREALMLKQGN